MAPLGTQLYWQQDKRCAGELPISVRIFIVTLRNFIGNYATILSICNEHALILRGDPDVCKKIIPLPGFLTCLSIVFLPQIVAPLSPELPYPLRQPLNRRPALTLRCMLVPALSSRFAYSPPPTETHAVSIAPAATTSTRYRPTIGGGRTPDAPSAAGGRVFPLISSRRNARDAVFSCGATGR